ncbi:hypothetical protein Ae406Ps2_6437c [Pseudonocardia sp. Ae406_Ps2]|nr:hypothetical protein Ae406Ps2_6437c [Pseudonocardia sp. Ae406_Ps2]
MQGRAALVRRASHLDASVRTKVEVDRHMSEPPVLTTPRARTSAGEIAYQAEQDQPT